MIKVKAGDKEVILTPTIFPDGTSQVWKLDREILSSRNYLITWNFESEREIIDLYSFMTLLRTSNPNYVPFTAIFRGPVPSRPYIALHIPYLPYGRQDKNVSNDSTFNLEVFANLINALEFNAVVTLDAHNPEATKKLIKNFADMTPSEVHKKIISQLEPTFIVFPDKGAMERYGTGLSQIHTIFCDKVRDQATGQILGITVNMNGNRDFINRDRLLIVDDICDGGATFIGVAKALREKNEHVQINLFVTHGIFSRGKDHLLRNGIDNVYTTNSLLRNKDSFPV